MPSVNVYLLTLRKIKDIITTTLQEFVKKGK